LSSCGEDQQAKVCECSKLYDEFSLKADQAEAAGGDWVDTYKEASEAAGEKSTECEKFHKEIGDSKFHEMKGNCI
jgi:hypothetical protein